MSTRMRNFFDLPQKWGRADCFRFVHAHCCDMLDRDIDLDWDAGYLGSKDEADMIRRLKKRGIGFHEHLVNAFLKPLGLTLREGEYMVGDVLVFDNYHQLAVGDVVYFPSLGIVDDDYSPIEYNDGWVVSLCELPIKEAWHYAQG